MGRSVAPLGLSAELAAQGVLPAETNMLALLLVGSRAQGWANPTSDYDFCVLTAQPYRNQCARAVAVPLDPPVIWTRDFAMASGNRCEVAYWTAGQLDQMLGKVSWDRFESGEASLRPLTDVEQTLIERLATAIALAGEDRLAAYREQADASAFRAFLTTFSVSSADGKLEDIAGMAEAGDTDSAVLAARLALDHMVDAMLDSRGVYGTGIPKWRMRRLRELADPPLSAARYWTLTTMASFRPDAPLDWVSEVVTECQDLSLRIDIAEPVSQEAGN
jgi:hypothetical protein